MFTSQSGMWLSACIFGRRQKLWTPTSSSPTPSLPFSQMFCNFSINALPENATSIVITINPDALSTQVSVYWIVGLAGFVTIIISLSRIIHNLDSESSSESESEQPPSPREKLRRLSWRKLMRATYLKRRDLATT
ncbi:hypothetical protein A0H81_08467 [Grifola frondosa]|uniref:Uncharacterized protein n=1 Tax=Grifola frondosa TaxID=5627 RepID=A0A1C7M4D5_GRIFR|nr:hypothetical protein A0H81_08467 [Grifola frondosa]